MQCKMIQNVQNDYIDQQLTVEQVADIELHLSSCSECSRDVELLKIQKQALASLPAIPVPQTLAKRVISAATAENATGSIMGKMAVAATVAVLAISVSLFYNTNVKEASPYDVAVDSDVTTVKVAIDSEQSLSGVTLRVEVSDNLELAGFGDKKQIYWTTGLQKGVNVISLPIIGLAEGKGDITTRIILNGKEKTMHITTQYKQPGNVFLQLDDSLNS